MELIIVKAFAVNFSPVIRPLNLAANRYGGILRQFLQEIEDFLQLVVSSLLRKPERHKHCFVLSMQ